MVQATVPADLEVYMDENDPTEPGDIKVVQSAILELNDCDATTDWTTTGTGVTVEVFTESVKEGVGCLKITFPAGVNGLATYTKPSTSWDLRSPKKYIRAWMRIWGAYVGSLAGFHIYFGETTATEQDSGSLSLTASWVRKPWDISGIAAGSRDAVTKVAIGFNNTSGTDRSILVDYIVSDAGPAQGKLHDGSRAGTFYPKVYVGTYEGTLAHQTVSIPRKGAPSYIRVFCVDADEPPQSWVYGMADAAVSEDGLGTRLSAAAGVHNVVECSFDVPGNVTGCNVNGNTYVCVAMFED